MAEIERYRELISKAESVASYMEALEVIDAYDKLEELGIYDVDDFLFEYIREGTTNKYLRTALEDHLLFDEGWLFKAAEYRTMFDLIEEFGPEALTKVKVKELFGKAEDYKKKGNFKDAVKCLNEALDLRPGDEEIEKKLSELSAHQSEGASLIPKELRPLVEKLSILESVAHLPTITCSYNPEVTMGSGFDKDTYCIGERIMISIKAPEEKDGFMTVFHYDDKDNLTLLYPDKSTTDTSVGAGKEKKIGIVATKPIGTHYLKAFWTCTKILKPEEVNFGDEPEIATTIANFIKVVRDLSSDDWIESVSEFEIAEN